MEGGGSIVRNIHLVWALWKLNSKASHKHIHVHEGTVHLHVHNHNHLVTDSQRVPHKHEHSGKSQNLTPWILFLVFVLGPCEPLIPILMYPAAQASATGLIAVTTVFAITTIATMLAVTLALTYGFSFIKFGKLEKYTHVIAGSTIILSGILILFGL